MTSFHPENDPKNQTIPRYRRHLPKSVHRHGLTVTRLFLLTLILHALTGCATLTPAPGEGEYTLIAVGSTEQSYQFMKYSQKTGQTWGLGDKWEPLEDEEILPESHFVIKMIDLQGDYFIAVRMDRNSGIGWSIENRKWAEIENNESRKLKTD